MAESPERLKFQDYYEQKHQIGRGGAGFVYECIAKENREHYAVKVYDIRNETDLERIKTEIEICTNIDHENIAAFIEAFEGPRICHLVFEIMVGGDVFEEMERRTVYSEFDASHLMRQVFQGVAYLHEKKILHRDLKPENLLLSNKNADAIVKICDFDSAMYCTEKIKLLNFRVSLPYCAPDIIYSDGYWFPVDMWACGVILFLALFGELPFKGFIDDELIDRIMDGIYVFPKDCKPVCKEAEELIHRLLRRDQRTRCTAKDALNNRFIKHPDIFASRDHRAKAFENIKAFNLTKKACRTETKRACLRSKLDLPTKSSSTDAIENYRSMSKEVKLSRAARRAVTIANIPMKIPEATAQELLVPEASVPSTELETLSLT